tara:strand:+ start:28 stop:357 length:330 start_codon:yes stop_codon:yes gene_type:complete
MIKRLLLLVTLGLTLSGCFMVPMALVGPATSNFSTASLMQSGISQTASFVLKQKTGKTIYEHAFATFDSFASNYVINSLSENILRQSYLPISKSKKYKNLKKPSKINIK